MESCLREDVADAFTPVGEAGEDEEVQCKVAEELQPHRVVEDNRASSSTSKPAMLTQLPCSSPTMELHQYHHHNLQLLSNKLRLLMNH